jgi:hypothetical protein
MAGRLGITAFRILLRIMLTHTHLRVYMHAYISLLTPLIGKLKPIEDQGLCEYPGGVCEYLRGCAVITGHN